MKTVMKMSPVPELEKAFTDTTRILLGTNLTGLDSYGQWLGKHVPLPYPAKSAVSGKEVWVPSPLNYLGKRFNKDRIIDLDEMDKMNVSPFSAKETAAASPKELRGKFAKPLAYHCGNFRHWEHENVEKCSGAGDGRNLYYCEDSYLKIKNVAFSNYPLFCQNVFGSYAVQKSSYLIHAYNSISVTRCFEIDGCSNSSDLLFCHNCEGVQSSMFCFNAKNMRYAIGNVPLGPEKFREIRGRILAEIGAELLRTKNYRWDIFNVGDKRKS